MPKITDPEALQYLGQPAPGIVASRPGTGPKPPAGFVRPEQETPLVPVGDKAPGYIREIENIKGDAQIRAAAASAQIKAANDLRQDRERRAFEAKQAQKLTPAQIAEARQRMGNLGVLRNQIERSAQAYDAFIRGAGGNPDGSIIDRIGEYMPGSINAKNGVFDKSVSGLVPLAKSAFRTPGEGTFDKTDFQAFMGMLPDRWNRDPANVQAYRQMRAMVDEKTNEERRLLGLPPIKRPAPALPKTSGAPQAPKGWKVRRVD